MINNDLAIEGLHLNMQMAQGQISNLQFFITGHISGYDPSTHRCTVLVPWLTDDGESYIETGWLQMGTLWTGNGFGMQICPWAGATQDSPNDGEQVLIQVENREGNFYINGLWTFNNADVAPGSGYNDFGDDASVNISTLSPGEGIMRHASGNYITFLNDGSITISANPSPAVSLIDGELVQTPFQEPSPNTITREVHALAVAEPELGQMTGQSDNLNAIMDIATATEAIDPNDMAQKGKTLTSSMTFSGLASDGKETNTSTIDTTNTASSNFRNTTADTASVTITNTTSNVPTDHDIPCISTYSVSNTSNGDPSTSTTSFDTEADVIINEGDQKANSATAETDITTKSDIEYNTDPDGTPMPSTSTLDIETDAIGNATSGKHIPNTTGSSTYEVSATGKYSDNTDSSTDITTTTTNNHGMEASSGIDITTSTSSKDTNTISASTGITTVATDEQKASGEVTVAAVYDQSTSAVGMTGDTIIATSSVDTSTTGDGGTASMSITTTGSKGGATNTIAAVDPNTATTDISSTSSSMTGVASTTVTAAGSGGGGTLHTVATDRLTATSNFSTSTSGMSGSAAANIGTVGSGGGGTNTISAVDPNSATTIVHTIATGMSGSAVFSEAVVGTGGGAATNITAADPASATMTIQTSSAGASGIGIIATGTTGALVQISSTGMITLIAPQINLQSPLINAGTGTFNPVLTTFGPCSNLFAS